MKKLEQKFNTLFNHWVKASFPFTAAYELKHTRGKDYLNFSEVREHQIMALKQAKDGVFIYKISDIGMIQVPFDCFSLCEVSAFVVIKYPEFFSLIDIDIFIKEKEASIRKSLTSSRAKAISFMIVD